MGEVDPKLDAVLKRLNRSGRPAPGTCLSAEVLAAWADGGLPPAERSLVEAHAADCPRCMDVLAGIVRSTPDVSERGAWWRVPLRVRWAVPAVAAATAFALWIYVGPPPPAVSELPAAPPPPATIEAGRPAPGNQAAAPVSPPPAPGQPEAQRRRAPASKETPAPEMKTARADETREFRTAVPARPEDTLSGPPLPQAAPAPPLPAPAAPTRGEREQAALEKSAAAATARTAFLDQHSAPEVISPDRSSRWRLDGGSIDRSIDGGATWTRQFTGAVTLFAGHAPTASVCWIVGREGIVLRSTDGRTWERAAAPAPADLTGVTAMDARTATVTAADGRIFRTSDGGRSWFLQESPAAPF